MQRVPFSLPAIALALARRELGVHTGLLRQRMRDGSRIEQHPQERTEELPKEPQQSIWRVVQGRFVERKRLRGRCRCRIDGYRALTSAAPQLFEEFRFQAAWIENRLETPRGQLLD